MQKFLFSVLNVCLLLLTGQTCVWAQQNTDPVTFPLPHENLLLEGLADYALADKDISSLNEILSLSFQPLKSKEGKTFWPVSDSIESVWIRFVISNKLLKDTAVVLKVEPYIDRMIAYEAENGNLKLVGKSGSRMPLSQLSIPDDNKRVKIPLKAGQMQTFFLREQRDYHTWLYIPLLQSEETAMLEQRNYEQKVIMPIDRTFILLTGFHLAIFFFSLMRFYSQRRDRAYFLNSVFNGFNCLYYLCGLHVFSLESRWWSNLRNDVEIATFLNVLVTISYIAFQMELLQLKTYKPRFVKWVKVYWGIVLVILMLAMIAGQLRIWRSVLFICMLLSHSGIYLFCSCLLIYLWNKRKGFNKYIFYGALWPAIGLSTYIPTMWFGLWKYLPDWFAPGYLMIVPVAVDALFFLMALVYRDKQVEIEKVQYQQQLIEQLEKNKALQDNFTQNLTQQVKEKTEQLIQQRSILEQEREAKLMAEFERKFSESELKALRSQINPHFIFNVLNTIESHTLLNNREIASDIIQKFSKLTRLVLENSLQQIVPFEQDLRALQLYVELEQMRYEEKFRVQYNIDESLLEGNCFIPPMIIQPYAENAILHGLRNLSSEHGLLQISGQLSGECIVVMIEDNGIGRRRSALLKRNNPIAKSSVGMKVTHDRIAVFNSLVKGNKARVEIEDMQRGTRVKLWLPLSYDL